MEQSEGKAADVTTHAPEMPGPRQMARLALGLAQAGFIDHELAPDPNASAGPSNTGAETGAETALLELLGAHLPGPVFRLGPWRYGVAAGSDPAGLAARLTAALRKHGQAGAWRLTRLIAAGSGMPSAAPVSAEAALPAVALLGRAAQTGQALAADPDGPGATGREAPMLVLSAGFGLAAAEAVLSNLAPISPMQAALNAGGSADATLGDALAPIEAGLQRLEATLNGVERGHPALSAGAVDREEARDHALQAALERLERLRGALQGLYRRLDAHEGALSDITARLTAQEDGAEARASEALQAAGDPPAPPAWAQALLDALTAREASEAARSQHLANEIGNLRLILTGLRDRLGGLERRVQTAAPAADQPPPGTAAPPLCAQASPEAERESGRNARPVSADGQQTKPAKPGSQKRARAPIPLEEQDRSLAVHTAPAGPAGPAASAASDAGIPALQSQAL